MCVYQCPSLTVPPNPNPTHPPRADDLPGENEVPASLAWEPARRPPAASGISCRAVQADVKLLQAVAMERRRRRFAEGGALALNRCKLSFRLNADGNPEAFNEYPIRDSNRTIEEYMLLANYLVAERLCEVRACVRFPLSFDLSHQSLPNISAPRTHPKLHTTPNQTRRWAPAPSSAATHPRPRAPPSSCSSWCGPRASRTLT